VASNSSPWTKEAREKALTRALPGDVKRVIEILALASQAATKKADALINVAGAGHRWRGAYKHHGASTGRWTSSGLQNIKKLNGLDVDATIAVISTGDYAQAKAAFPNPLETIGSCIRPMFVAAPGRRLMGADFSGIEARVLAWLAGDEAEFQVYRDYDAGRGPDPYIVAYARAFNIHDYGDVNDQQRQVGKVMVLALGFQGGVGAFQNMAKNYGVTVSDDEADKLKRAWRDQHPRVVTFWNELSNAAIAAVWKPDTVHCVGRIAFRRDGNFLYMRLPSSRKLAYPFPKLISDGPFGDYKLSFKDASAGQWRDVRHGHGCYGGILTENCVSGVAPGAQTGT
jgi:DNA polymerase bacteriophage-type